MSPFLLALSLPLVATICWMAVAAGLLPGQAGLFAATALSRPPRFARWAPFAARGRNRA